MKKAVIIIIITIIVLCSCLGIYFLIQNSAKKRSLDAENELLNKISSEFLMLDSNYVKQTKEIYNITSTVKNNNIIVELLPLHPSIGDKITYNFKQDGDYLKFNSNSVLGTQTFSNIITAVEKVYQYEDNILNKYINSVISLKTNTDYFSYIENEDDSEYAIYIKEKIDESILKSTIDNDYVRVTDLQVFDSAIKAGEESLVIYKGKITLKLIENSNNQYTFIIAEKDNITDLSFKSILEVVKYLYPDEFSDFNLNVKSISNNTYGRYTINTNVDQSIIDNKFSENEVEARKFVSLTISK